MADLRALLADISPEKKARLESLGVRIGAVMGEEIAEGDLSIAEVASATIGAGLIPFVKGPSSVPEILALVREIVEALRTEMEEPCPSTEN